MLDFDHHRPSGMFPATISLTDVTSSLGMAPQEHHQHQHQIDNNNHNKFVNGGHVFVQQPYALQIIQLVEEPAPPRPLRKSANRSTSDIDASSVASSSSYWSSDYTSSACSEDSDEECGEGEEEEEEEDCSSYCSSDLPPQEQDGCGAMEGVVVDNCQRSACPTSADTYSVRMKRILAWREDFYAQAAASLSETSLPSLKRKLVIDDEDEDSVSHSSKRSRSESSLWSRSNSSVSRQSLSSLGMHSCPACDAFFDTQQSLRQHGLDAKAKNDGAACSVAVEYEFE